MNKISKNAVNKSKIKLSQDLQDISIKYHITPIIQALTTGILSQTKNTKKTTKDIIKVVLKITGKNLSKNHKNIIIIVILNPETATKWVSQELLKEFCISFGISSLAQISIHHKKIASWFGYKL